MIFRAVRFKGITVLDLIRISVGHDLTVSQACEYLSEVGLCDRDYIHREVNSSLFWCRFLKR